MLERSSIIRLQKDRAFDYDSSVYIATVSVKNLGSQIVPVLTGVKKLNDRAGRTCSLWPEHITFDNLYRTGGLTIQKTAGADTDLTGKRFYFTVEKGGKYFDLQGNAHDAVENAVIEVPCSTKDGGSVTIAKLEKGTYTITEVADRDGKAIVDNAYPYTVDNNGTEVIVDGNQNAKAEIKNTQKYVTFAAEAVKEVEGRPDGNIEKFEFGLYDEETLLMKAENGTDGRISFDEVKIPYSGETESFRYTMKEIIPENDKKKPGYEYDNTEIPVTVTVTPQDGQEAAVSVVYGEEGQLAETAKFVNKYTAKETIFTIDGTKEVTGTTSTDWYSKWFTFRLQEIRYDELSGTYIPVENQKELTAQNDGSKFSFELTYTQEDAVKGKFIYLLTEDAGTRSFTYDASAYLLYVDVKDNGDGTIEVAKEFAKVLDKDGLPYDGDGEESILFSNAYKSSSTDTPGTGGNTGGGSGGGGGSGSGGRRYTTTGGPGATTIDPGEVPLAEQPILPDTTLIDDGMIPMAALPKTGDDMSWITLNILLSGVLLALISLKKKREDAELVK